jgi:hypothetical protein
MTANSVTGPTSTHSQGFDVFGGLRRRILASIAATVGWLCLTLLYVAFWAHGFSLFQSIVVVVVSLLVLAAFLMGAWVSYGMRFAGRWPD